MDYWKEICSTMLLDIDLLGKLLGAGLELEAISQFKCYVTCDMQSNAKETAHQYFYSTIRGGRMDQSTKPHDDLQGATKIPIALSMSHAYEQPSKGTGHYNPHPHHFILLALC